MATYDAVIESNRSPEETFDYLATFSNAQAWDPGVASGEPLQSGPPKVGSAYRLGIPVGPRTVTFVYRIVELDRPRRVVLRAEHALVRSIDTITVGPTEHGAVVHYGAVLEPKGILRLFAPLLDRRFREIGDRAAAGLRSTLQ